MLSKSKTQTQKLAAKLAKTLLLERSPVPHIGIMAKKIISGSVHKNARVLALIGDLGSGKTAFVQGFIKSLGIKTHVPSPTFVIYRKYPIHSPFIIHNSPFRFVYHFDLYRIQKSKEIINLDFSAGGGPAFGWKKFIANPENIVLIEWPEKIMRFLPKKTIIVKFEHGKKMSERIVKIIGN